jgi:hypothetical protein
MVATLKSGGSVDQLLDSLSPEQREALIHSLDAELAGAKVGGGLLKMR